jgi:hypothetical protein
VAAPRSTLAGWWSWTAGSGSRDGSCSRSATSIGVERGDPGTRRAGGVVRRSAVSIEQARTAVMPARLPSSRRSRDRSTRRSPARRAPSGTTGIVDGRITSGSFDFPVFR